MHEIAQPFSAHQVAEREGPSALRRIAYPFRYAVAPGETKDLTLPVPQDGTVEAVNVRFYPGVQLAVRVNPYVINDRGTRRELLQYVKGGKPYIDGDDDRFRFVTREPIFWKDKDVIHIQIVNTLDPAATNPDLTIKYPAAQYTYDIAVDVEIDFAGGPWPYLVVIDHA